MRSDHALAATLAATLTALAICWVLLGRAEAAPAAAGEAAVSAATTVAGALAVAREDAAIRTDASPSAGEDASEVATVTAVTLRGSVVAAEGGAVSGANVIVGRGSCVLADVVSDANGEFRFSFPPAMVMPLHVSVWRSGRVSVAATWPPSARAGEVVAEPLVMNRAAIVQGFVLDPAGAPVREGRVLVVPAGNTPELELATGADGSFGSDEVAPGAADIWARGEGHRWTRAGPFLLAAGRACDCGVIRLGHDRTLEVVVSCAGQPIRRAEVEVSLGARRFPLAAAHTDDAGRCELRGLPDAGVQLTVCADGCASASVSVAAHEARVAIVLERWSALCGRVFAAATGAPVADALVVLLPYARNRMAPPQPPFAAGTPEVRSMADGSFRFDAVRPGDFDLWVTAAGHGPAKVSLPVAVGVAPEPLQVRLPADVAVSGHVLRADGAPVAGARVEAWCLPDLLGVTVIDLEGFGQQVSPGEELLRRLGPAPADARAQLLGACTTDAQGAYRIDGLPNCHCLVVASAHGSSASGGRVVSGEGNPPLELVLETHGSVVGRVTGGVDQVRVVLFGGSAWTRTATPLSDGSFRIRDVPPGSYLVRAFREPIAPRMHEMLRALLAKDAREQRPDLVVTSGAQLSCELTVVEPATGTVAGEALEGGLPAAGRRVQLRPADDGGGDRCRAATVTPTGAFEVPFVPAGRYRVSLFAGDRELCWSEATVATGSRVVLALNAIR